MKTLIELIKNERKTTYFTNEVSEKDNKSLFFEPLKMYTG